MQKKRAGAIAAVVAVMLVPVETMSADAADRDRRLRLGGVKVRLEPGTRQVVTVNHTEGWHAKVTLWRKSDGRWERRMTARDGRTG